MTRFGLYDDGDLLASSSSDEDDEQEKLRNVKSRMRAPSAPADDDDDEESSESDNDSDDSFLSKSGASEMQEDELGESPKRRKRKSRSRDRNALVEDENGEIRYAHELDTRVSPGEKSRPGPRADPTIIPWAQHVGVDPQKMHVMQSSLFRVPEEAAALKVIKTTKPKSSVKRLNIPSPAPSLSRKHSRDSDGDGARFGSPERAPFENEPILRPSRKYARVELKSSVASGSEGAHFDAGLAMGRSFRVGWGPGGQLVHVGSICSPTSTSHSSANSSVVTITKTLPSLTVQRSGPGHQYPSDAPPALASILLQHHLSHTRIRLDDAKIPCAYPSNPFSSTPSTSTHSASPLDFSSFASLFPSTDSSNPAPIFRLGNALFDPVDLRLGRSRTSAVTPEIRTRVGILRRKAMLSKWLEDVVKPTVEVDLRVHANATSSQYTAADAAFAHLTGHQIEEACTKAADGGYIKLATLISQAGGDDLYKEDILAQLDIWRAEKLSPGSLQGSQNGLVGRAVWRIYKVLAGVVELDEEKHQAEDDICVGLDWKRVFGLCMWYGSSVDASVDDVVRTYERILLQRSRPPSLSSNPHPEISRPIPKWAASKARRIPQQPSLATSRLGLFLQSGSRDASNEFPDDPLYALIKLFADPAMSLSHGLDPLSFAANGVDWGIAMCWHLYIILSRVMRVRDFSDRQEPRLWLQTHDRDGWPHTDSSNANRDNSREDSEGPGNNADDIIFDGHCPTADLLTSTYAFELESWDMLQEAVFVLMHIEGKNGRKKAIKELLARSAPKLDDWTVRALVGSLSLPMAWIDEAKALHELDCGNVYAAYELFLSAQCYQEAHKLAIQELTPDVIICKDYELLKRLFEPFVLSGRTDRVKDWAGQGQAVYDYATIAIGLPKLLDGAAAQAEDHENNAGDQARADQISFFASTAVKIVTLFPNFLNRKREEDPRHPAALEEVTRDLLKLVERARPRALTAMQEPTSKVLDGSSKISLIRDIGYARFLQSIEA